MMGGLVGRGGVMVRCAGGGVFVRRGVVVVMWERLIGLGACEGEGQQEGQGGGCGQDVPGAVAWGEAWPGTGGGWARLHVAPIELHGASVPSRAGFGKGVYVVICAHRRGRWDRG